MERMVERCIPQSSDPVAPGEHPSDKHKGQSRRDGNAHDHMDKPKLQAPKPRIKAGLSAPPKKLLLASGQPRHIQGKQGHKQEGKPRNLGSRHHEIGPGIGSVGWGGEKV